MGETEVVAELDVIGVDGWQLPLDGDVGYSGEACDVIQAFLRAVIVVSDRDLCDHCATCVTIGTDSAGSSGATLRICRGSSTRVVVSTTCGESRWGM